MLLSFLTSKLGIGLIILFIMSGLGWYVKHLIGENAVLEAVVGAERAAMVGFAKEVSADIEGYKVAMGVLLSSYQEADNEQERLEELLAEHDLGLLAKSKPNMVARRINRGTARMFNSIEIASGYTRNTGSTRTTKAGSDTH